MTAAAENMTPVVSMPKEGLLYIDYSDCTTINDQSVRAVRQQVRDNWPDLLEVYVLQVFGDIRNYTIDPELFGGRGRDFRVIYAAWVIDASMQYGMERALQSYEPNHIIKLFSDHDEAETWIGAKMAEAGK